MQNPNLFVAFGAGVLSFLTPCCLPIFPAFLSYITGVSVDELQAGTAVSRRRVLQHSVAFFIGFSTIYVALGLVASALGSFFIQGRSWLPIVGGLFVILMGLSLVGIIKLPFLMRERRIQFARKPQGYAGSVLVGLAYAAGWTPCIGPILGAVLGMAASSPGQGAPLLFAYSIGFAAPFIVLAYALGSARWLTRYSLAIERIGGGFMVLTGALLATGSTKLMSAWLIRVTGFQGF
ncbi:MAG: cytochrome biosis protein [Firmicutes bacterium]|nr:cytochrome biosis protein [Bacillota bacterium]